MSMKQTRLSNGWAVQCCALATDAAAVRPLLAEKLEHLAALLGRERIRLALPAMRAHGGGRVVNVELADTEF